METSEKASDIALHFLCSWSEMVHHLIVCWQKAENYKEITYYCITILMMQFGNTLKTARAVEEAIFYTVCYLQMVIQLRNVTCSAQDFHI